MLSNLIAIRVFFFFFVKLIFNKPFKSDCYQKEKNINHINKLCMAYCIHGLGLLGLQQVLAVNKQTKDSFTNTFAKSPFYTPYDIDRLIRR